MNETPSAFRLHIAMLGRRNAGKSSLLNALTGQDAALVSPVAGTTTDVVQKGMEVPGIGPCLFLDTPGFDDDEGELGQKRVERTVQALERADLVLLFCEEGSLEEELKWFRMLRERKVPVVPLINKVDVCAAPEVLSERVLQVLQERPVRVCALRKEGLETLRQAILEKLPEDFGRSSILGGLVSAGDSVLLVMPQDAQAPKGRLILPQAQTLRELLDRQCIVHCCTLEGLSSMLRNLSEPPHLIITDSQVFRKVYEQKPVDSRLTSFSILMAGYKGDIRQFVEGATAIACLHSRSRVLIAEACTHAPLSEDIGRVRIPSLLRARLGAELHVDVVAGRDFPEDLSSYDLVIHCGACMFNRKLVMHRLEKARSQHVPMTNYGVAIAYLNGILNDVVLPE